MSVPLATSGEGARVVAMLALSLLLHLGLAVALRHAGFRVPVAEPVARLFVDLVDPVVAAPALPAAPAPDRPPPRPGPARRPPPVAVEPRPPRIRDEPTAAPTAVPSRGESGVTPARAAPPEAPATIAAAAAPVTPPRAPPPAVAADLPPVARTSAPSRSLPAAEPRSSQPESPRGPETPVASTGPPQPGAPLAPAPLSAPLRAGPDASRSGVWGDGSGPAMGAGPPAAPPADLGAGGVTAGDAGGAAGAPGHRAEVAALHGGRGQPVPPEYEAYVQAFRRRVQERLVYPWLAVRQRLQGVIEIEVDLDPDGRVGAVHARATPGPRVLREAAERAVRDAAPLPWPAGLAPRPLTIRLPIVFEIR